MKPVVFRPDAEAEFSDAVIRYEEERAGRGVRFRDAVHAARDLIAANPGIGGRVRRTNCRRYILTGFPYSVIYTEGADTIEIVAVAHHRRRPGYWRDRLGGP